MDTDEIGAPGPEMVTFAEPGYVIPNPTYVNVQIPGLLKNETPEEIVRSLRSKRVRFRLFLWRLLRRVGRSSY